MKSIPVQSLKPNTVLSGIAYLDEHYILLTSETPVTEELLKRLSMWDFKEIYSEDALDEKSLIEDDDGEVALSTFQDDALDTRSREETQKFYTSALEYAHKLFDTYLKRNVIPIEPLTDQIKLLIAMMRKNKKFLLRIGELDRSGFSYIVCHSVNVSILSIAVGDTLKLPSHKLIELGMAGFLHEIGMFKLPDTFQSANRPLTPNEKRALTAHPLLGYRALKDLGFPPNVTLAVLEHHEKEDGSGYPQGLTGDKIAMSAKILAVASAYDAQISSRPYRTARSGHASLLDLLKEIKKSYDDQILRRLIFTLSLYPIGSHVELKTGAIAVVDDANPEDPKRPDVKVLTNEKKMPLADFPILRLSERGDMDIVRLLNSDEVSRFRADKIIPA